MTQNHKQLFGHCVNVLNTYNGDTMSVEEHVNKYLKENGIFDESDQTFIVEVFSECVRYSNLMHVVLNGFYNKDGKRTLRSEQNLYHVICYLATFRLDELGMAHFRKFVNSQDVNKMYRFLSFFLNEKNLLTWIKDGWEKYYEHVFVQTSLLSPIQRWMPEINDMLLMMKNTIDNRLKPKSRASLVTETKPFNITQPRPRSIPIPEPIPKLQKHKPAPPTLYEKPAEFDMIQRSKNANRRRAEERLIEASGIRFACANPYKSEKTKEIMNNIISEEESKIDFEKHRANPAPAFLSREVPVKMNTAQILREGKLYQQREEEVLKKLENLEAGAKDASDFLKWQSEMRQKDLEAKLSDIERRRLEGKLSHEEAIFARQNLIKENKQKVQEMKEETQKMMQEFLEKKFKEEKEMRNLVEETMQGHKNAKEASKKLKEYKRKIVQEVNEESKELMKQALEEKSDKKEMMPVDILERSMTLRENDMVTKRFRIQNAEAEMRRKMDLIHQIKAMEAVPIIRQKLVDFTELAGHGLLSEMSIAELKERVALCKAAEKEAEEIRRDDILQNKESKDQLLLDTLEKISKHRLEQTRAAATRLEAKKKSEPKKVVLQDEKLTELERKLQERKAQRMKERESAKSVSNHHSASRTKSLINQKRALEENRWRELELTQERAAKLMDGNLGKSKSGSRLASNLLMAQ